jgi:hypothetical protein
MKTFLALLCFFSLSSAFAATVKRERNGQAYLVNIFGHIHQNPTKSSQSLTTIACGHPLRLLKEIAVETKTETVLFAGEWNLVASGPYEGYIRQEQLTAKKPECFQDRFPKFFNDLGLEVTDMFYWGRLYDHYEMGKSEQP